MYLYLYLFTKVFVFHFQCICICVSFPMYLYSMYLCFIFIWYFYLCLGCQILSVCLSVKFEKLSLNHDCAHAQCHLRRRKTLNHTELQLVSCKALLPCSLHPPIQISWETSENFIFSTESQNSRQI